MTHPSDKQIVGILSDKPRTTAWITKSLYPNARPWKYNEYRNRIYFRLRKLEKFGLVKGIKGYQRG